MAFSGHRKTFPASTSGHSPPQPNIITIIRSTGSTTKPTPKPPPLPSSPPPLPSYATTTTIDTIITPHHHRRSPHPTADTTAPSSPPPCPPSSPRHPHTTATFTTPIRVRWFNRPPTKGAFGCVVFIAPRGALGLCSHQGCVWQSTHHKGACGFINHHKGAFGSKSHHKGGFVYVVSQLAPQNGALGSWPKLGCVWLM
ncbi:hypothetical protein Tco_0587539 [Tanacetum coccineum]